MNNKAAYTAVSGQGLFRRHNADSYELPPAKGARVSGTISVGISSDEQSDTRWGNRDKVTCPTMWVDYTPDLADESKTTGGRSVLTVNGREYGEGFGNSLSGRVELFPRAKNDHRDEYYSRLTINGDDYYLRATFNAFDQVSEAARKVLGATVEAIAAEYITDERWHAYRVERAEYRVERATEERDKAQDKLDAAIAELQAL